MRRKIWGLLVILCMLAAFVPCVSAAESGTCGDNATWTLENNTLTISGTGEVTKPNDVWEWWSKRLSIKSVIINSGITSIDDNIFGSFYVTNVSIPNTVKTIGKNAFYGCRLEKIALPNSLITIGDNAFDDNPITNVTIPSRVQFIGKEAFSCSSLESIDVDGNNKNYSSKNGVLFNKTKTALIQYPAAKSGSSYDIPDTVKTIAENAFAGTKLESIKLPEGLETIGASAFYNCDALQNINLPNGITTINNAVFSGCSALENINIPNTVVEIGNGAFSRTAIKQINLPDNLISIGNYAFSHCSSLEDINIPTGVTKIGDYAFSETKIKNITIPGTVTELGSQLFYRTTSLENAEFEYGITQIPWSTFCYCSNLKSVSLPAGVTEIGAYAFADCQSLSSIKIPKSLTTIKNASFTNCYNLKDVYYEGSEEQWSKITIDTYDGYDGGDYYVSNSAIINATKHYKTGGFPAPEIDEITSATNNHNGTYTVIAAVSDIPYDCVIVAALYDENGLTGINTQRLSTTDTEKTITVAASSANTAKVFIWDSIKGMRPLCEAKTMTIR